MDSELLELRRRVLFPQQAQDFSSTCAALRHAWESEYESATEMRQARIRFLLAALTIDLGSYLPHWRLLAGSGVTVACVEAEITSNCAALQRMGATQIANQVHTEIASIRGSNFLKLATLSDMGRLQTRSGHDAAVGLTTALHRGAVLVTTNPVMINEVRKKDPATWAAVKRQTRATHPGATAEEIASLMTMEVVLRNCREMRPIFEASGGKYGHVCLQINPRNCTNSDEMSAEARQLYRELAKELGGTPNTSFKVPGTEAGLTTAAALTAEGISVTITASASVSQILRFGEIIEQGRAPISHLVMMTGRFDDPVREELLRKGVPGAEEASRWGSIAVVRRAYDILHAQRGYTKSTLLIASIRGPWAIDGCIANGPGELVITVFPDQAGVYDAETRPIQAHIAEPVPPAVLAILSQSEIFQKGYGIDALTPTRFDTFHPVAVTMKQFIASYEEFLEYIRAE